MDIIKLVNITKRYGNAELYTYALNNVSLSIKEGELIAITGPSGSGKTTLLNIMGCLDTPSSGDYFLDDIQVNSMSTKDLAKVRNCKIGFVFQQFALLNNYSSIENVEMPLIYNNLHKTKNKLTSKERRELSIKTLTSVGLKKYISKQLNQLSGGQQQRVAIARALVNNPSIILADEPTGALDRNTSQEIINLLKEINSKEKTVIIITHDEHVASQCKRRVVIEDGKILS